MRAVERGRIEIVRHIKYYYKGTTSLHEFDFMAEDDRSGDTCGHIAARMGNLEIIRFLHEQ